MAIAPKERTAYLRMLRQMLDHVPDDYAVKVERQFGCRKNEGEGVSAQIGGQKRSLQAYSLTQDEAMVVVVHPIEQKPPEIPRLVPG